MPKDSYQCKSQNVRDEQQQAMQPKNGCGQVHVSKLMTPFVAFRTLHSYQKHSQRHNETHNERLRIGCTLAQGKGPACQRANAFKSTRQLRTICGHHQQQRHSSDSQHQNARANERAHAQAHHAAQHWMHTSARRGASMPEGKRVQKHTTAAHILRTSSTAAPQQR